MMKIIKITAINITAIIFFVSTIFFSFPGITLAGQGVLPPAGILSWWPGDNNAEDFVGSNHGILVNGATFGAGKVEQAFNLDGVNDYVNVKRTNFTNALTIEAWVYPRSFGAYSTIYAQWYDGTYGDRGIVFQIKNNNYLRLGVINDYNILDGYYVFQPNQWYHVAGTWDGSVSRVYVNGVLVGNRNTTGTFTNQNVDASIGRDPYPAQYYFNGLVDEVTLYNRALSASEIQAIFNAGSAGKIKDKIAPTTEASFSGTMGNDNWYRTDVEVTLTASDNVGGAGIERIEYSFNGTSWNTYTNPFTITSEGQTTFYYRSVDKAGNIEKPAQLATLQIDKTAPTLIFSNPSPQPNSNGWNSDDVSIAFTAEDNLSGVYSTSAASPLIFSTEGGNLYEEVTVTDRAGNTATFKSPMVNIDKSDPIIEINSPLAKEYSTKDIIEIDYLVRDLKVESVEAKLDGNPVNNGETINLADKAGSHNFTIVSKDFAGNQSEQSVNFDVVISAEVEINPNTLNLKSKGNFVTAYIELPEMYDISKVDLSSVKLIFESGEISVLSKPYTIGDNDGDEIADLMVKFDRRRLIELFFGGSNDISLSLVGSLDNGYKFQGMDIVRVVK